MSRLFNKYYNNIEFFEESDEADENDQQSEEQSTTDEKASEKVTKKISSIFQSITDVLKEDVKNRDYDEVDDELTEDEQDADPDKKEVDDMFEEDESDDEELTDEDIENLLKARFGGGTGDKVMDELLDKLNDEKDNDVYVPPVFDPKQLKVDPNLDEKLTDMGLDDDDADDNLFAQGGKNGEKAMEMINNIQGEGDELADLLISVPIDLINLMMETVLKLIGAVFEKPINSIDSYLEPIRNALNQVYIIFQRIVRLINNIIGLPIAFVQLGWSVLCNSLKVFGVRLGCTTNFQVNNMLIEIYESIANINIFKFKDLVYSSEFRNTIMDAIRGLFTKLKDVMFLILKVINLASKMIEYMFNVIKNIIQIIDEVTEKNNLIGFIVVCIMLLIFYLSLYGIKSAIETYNSLKERFS
jgi:hypothetical protein